MVMDQVELAHVVAKINGYSQAQVNISFSHRYLIFMSGYLYRRVYLAALTADTILCKPRLRPQP